MKELVLVKNSIAFETILEIMNECAFKCLKGVVVEGSEESYARGLDIVATLTVLKKDTEVIPLNKFIRKVIIEELNFKLEENNSLIELAYKESSDNLVDVINLEGKVEIILSILRSLEVGINE